MNVIILGSGGCVSTPRACCNCRVCTEARRKSFCIRGLLQKLERLLLNLILQALDEYSSGRLMKWKDDYAQEYVSYMLGEIKNSFIL